MSDSKGKGKFNWVRKLAPCFNPGEGDGASSSSGNIDLTIRGSDNHELWSYFDLGRHHSKKYSWAIVRPKPGRTSLCKIRVERLPEEGILVGMFDSHGSSDHCSTYVHGHLFENILGRIRDTSTMSVNLLREAFLITDASWLEKVDARFVEDPYIAGYGTCCLVGVFWRRTLYLANAGDSRAIIGRAHEDPAKINVYQVTTDDNVNNGIVRAEVQALHPNEPDFVVEDETTKGLYRIKGRIQVSKSIGDAYLKLSRFNLNHVDERFKLNAPVRDDNPALSADPRTYTIPIEPQDRFVIFASDGLWDMLTNQEAADIVHRNPKEGIAERLVIQGLTKVARRLGGTSYTDILPYRRDDGSRRKIHDDVSVVVVFFDDIGCTQIQGCIEGLYFNALDEIPLADIICRTVCIGNLPYGTSLGTLYPLLRIWGQMSCIVFGENGFWCQAVYYNPKHAVQFTSLNRDHLIISGKLACISFIWENHYRQCFSIVDQRCTQEEVPYTLHVSNLDALNNVNTIRGFFTRYGLQLRNHPIIHARSSQELYAFVSFISVQESRLALTLNGREHLGRQIRIMPSHEPKLKRKRWW